MSLLAYLLPILPTIDTRLNDTLSRWHSDDDFDGKRNYAILLVLIFVPVFWVTVIVLCVWWVWS